MTIHMWTAVAATALGLSLLGTLGCLLTRGSDEEDFRRIDRAGGIMLGLSVLSLVGFLVDEGLGRTEIRNAQYAVAVAAVRAHPGLSLSVPSDGRLTRYAYEDLLDEAVAIDVAKRDDALHSGRNDLAAEVSLAQSTP